MDSVTIKSWIKKIICWVLLIQMVNLSMDPIDQINLKNGHTYEEDLSINEIESVYELVSESVFDQDVPEADEQDEDAYVKIFNLYFNPVAANTIFFNTHKFILTHSVFYQVSSYAYHPEINSPPPKHA